jgi:hypothetical protein
MVCLGDTLLSQGIGLLVEVGERDQGVCRTNAVDFLKVTTQECLPLGYLLLLPIIDRELNGNTA